MYIFKSKYNLGISHKDGAAIFREGIYKTDNPTIAGFLRKSQHYGVLFEEITPKAEPIAKKK